MPRSPSSQVSFFCHHCTDSLPHLCFWYINAPASTPLSLMISLSYIHVVLCVFFFRPCQPMPMLLSSSDTVSTIPHICLHNNFFPAYLMCLFFRHLHCPASLPPPPPFDHIFLQSFFCFNRWDNIGAASIPPMLRHTRHCCWCHNPVHDTMVAYEYF